MRRVGWELIVIAPFRAFFCGPPEICTIQITMDSSQVGDAGIGCVSWKYLNPLSFLEALERGEGRK